MQWIIKKCFNKNSSEKGHAICSAKRLHTLLVSVLLLVLLSVPLLAYYYLEDFDAAADGWLLNYRYGRRGINPNPDNTHDISSGTGELVFTGRILRYEDASWAYEGQWVGRMALLSNRQFSASSENPFGVEYYRTYARLDPSIGYKTGTATTGNEGITEVGAQSFWFVFGDVPADNGSSSEFDLFDNYVLLYEKMRMSYNTGSGQPRSTWGSYISSENKFDLSLAEAPSGTSPVSLAYDASYPEWALERNYDDNWGEGTRDTYDVDDGSGGGTANNTYKNATNHIIIRMTHDGSTIRFFVNPNPHDHPNNPYRNEFFQIGSSGFADNQDFRIMTGMETKNMNTEYDDAKLDKVLVRSVASNLKAEIYPGEMAQGTTNNFQLLIEPEFSSDDEAGIGEIAIGKPAGYTNTDWDVNDIQVFSFYGSGTNHATFSSLQKMSRVGSVPTANDEVYISTNESSEELKLRFRQSGDDPNNAVIKNSTGSSAADHRVVVVFPMTVPDVANAAGDIFSVYADCVKYDGQNYSKWGTTGRMKAAAADIDSGSFDNDSLTVRTYSDPEAFATVSPDLVYIGEDRTVYLYVATTNANAAPLSEMFIKVPGDYAVNYVDSYKFSSLYINDDDQYVYATNISGTDYIHVDYSSDGASLPASGGLDRVTIQVDSTPTNFSGAQTNTYWYADVYSEVPGTVSSTCQTNATYPNRLVMVRQLPPVLTASLNSGMVENGTNFLYNHQKNNEIVYTVNNNGGVGNNIKRVRIQLPAALTNVENISSTQIPDGQELANLTFYPASNVLVVDYQGAGTLLSGGSSDDITLWISSDITPMSGSVSYDFTSEADNENGDGYVAGSEASGSWSLTWKNPPAAGNATVACNNSISSGATNRIYTTAASTSLQVSVNNTGGDFNNIKLVTITVPASFTNISGLSSLRIDDDTANIDVSGNTVYVRYYDDSAVSLENMASDTISMTLVDDVTLLAAQTNSFTIQVANTTNTADLQSTGILGEGSKKVAFVRPPVMASFALNRQEIDSSTVSNSISCFITNTGDYDNYMSELRIYIPDTIASNILDAESSYLGIGSPNVSVNTAGESNYVRILYEGGTRLYGGSEDTVSFTMVDHIEGETNLHITMDASNVQNVWTELAPADTNRIDIRIPPANAAAHVTPNVFYTASAMTTNTVVFVLSNQGSGGNHITNAVIGFPDELAYNIIGISNTMTNTWSLDNGSRTLTVWYTNGEKLEAGQEDRIYFTFRNSVSDVSLDNAFSATVDNGQGAETAEARSGRSLTISFVDQPEVAISQSDSSPNEIYTTDTISEFDYSVKNGASSGKALEQVLVKVPAPFVSEDLQVTSYWPGVSTSVLTTNGTEILLDYSVNDLDPGAEDSISLEVKDNLVLGITSVSWEARVDYGDGSGFHPARESGSGSYEIAFVFPDAEALASVVPDRINQNESAVTYTVTVTNNGVPGNHIKMLEVDFGSNFTNINAASSAILGSGLSVVSNSIVRINYENTTNTTNLPSQYADTLSIEAVDSISEPTNVTLSVRVANSTNESSYRSAGELSSGSLEMEFYRPDYVASVYLNAESPRYDNNRFMLKATETTATLSFHVVNNGAPGNDLDVFRFYIPDSLFDTGSFTEISSARVGTDSIFRSSNEVTVYYTNTGEALQASEEDTIVFQIDDLVDSTNALATWDSLSRFTTSGASFMTNAVATGQSNTIALVMPAPEAEARFLQHELYTTTEQFVLAADISNTGSGSSSITRVAIDIPAAFKSGLDNSSIASRLTNSFATNISYTGGTVSLFYDNFHVSSNDRIFLSLSNTASAAGQVSFSIQAANAEQSASVAARESGALDFSVVTPPSAYVEASSPEDGVANRRYSTDYEHIYKLYLKNDGTGSENVREAKITFPPGFSLGLTSSQVGSGSITVNSNIAVIDYTGGGAEIIAGSQDMLTATCVDPWNAGASNVSVSIEVAAIDNAGLSLNTNYCTTRLYSGKSLDLPFVHPSVEADYYIDGYASGSKPSIYVADEGTIATTNITVTFDNTADESNYIHQAVLSIPEVFSGISNVSASWSGAVASLSNDSIYVDYSANPLVTGSSDSLSFTVYYAQNDATNNLAFPLSVDNNNGEGLNAADVAAGEFHTMDMQYPPLIVFGGVKNINSMYTLLSNEQVEYVLKNRAQGYRLSKTVITNFDMSRFSSVQVSSSRVSSVTIATDQGWISLAYTNQLAFNETDTIKINVEYQITDNLVTTLTLQGRAYLTNEALAQSTNIAVNRLAPIDTDTGSENNQQIWLGPAPFALVSGSVLPTFKIDTKNDNSFLPNIVKVELVDPASGEVVSSPYAQEMGTQGILVNKSMQAYSEPQDGGRYTIGYVPPGTYRLTYNSSGFRQVSTNMTFASNTIYSLPDTVMKNDLLDSDARNEQIVVDYNDTNTYFILPPDSVIDQFALDIGVVDMNTAQESDVMDSARVAAPTAADQLGCFRFTLNNGDFSEQSGVPLGGDAVLVLHYATSNLNVPVPDQGTDWEEQNLAVYYWKETTKEWIPLGGQVDAEKNTVSVKIGYLHRYYAVLSVSEGAGGQAIYNVQASPNPFTPGRGDEQNNKVKLSFSFSDAHESYTISIYNMRGQLVRKFERDGSYAQGEVFWDGRNADDFKLPGGVYLYQIRAGDKVFSGTVLMLR